LRRANLLKDNKAVMAVHLLRVNNTALLLNNRAAILPSLNKVDTQDSSQEVLKAATVPLLRSPLAPLRFRHTSSLSSRPSRRRVSRPSILPARP
jgi:hypothetical protein